MRIGKVYVNTRTHRGDSPTLLTSFTSALACLLENEARGTSSMILLNPNCLETEPLRIFIPHQVAHRTRRFKAMLCGACTNTNNSPHNFFQACIRPTFPAPCVLRSCAALRAHSRTLTKPILNPLPDVWEYHFFLDALLVNYIRTFKKVALYQYK